jgi:hypothetical protein
MYVKIEPTGCCERKGLVQVRLCFYLDPGDEKYNEHHVQVPAIPSEGYQGKIDKDSMPEDRENYQKWLDELPKIWQNNPFHNHFIYVEPDVTDEEIMDKAEELLKESYAKWAKGEHPHLVNPKTEWPIKMSKDKKTYTVEKKRVTACKGRVKHLMETPLERRPGRKKR